MEDCQVNNIYKIKDLEVEYYEWAGQKYQFDEMFELTIDLDESDRNMAKIADSFPVDETYGLGTHRQPIIIKIQDIYDGMMKGTWDGRHPQMPVVKGYNSFIDKNSIRKTTGMFTPKIMLLLCDELNELMNADDYKSVDTVKQALGSIARLGRAAAVHLALACQRASGSTISTDLKNNIQMSCLLGGFDDGASTLMFEKDISNQAKPQIKGRGFVGSGNEIIETQTYFTQPHLDWEFDTNAALTFNNPEFLKQCKTRGVNVEELNTGWVKQYPLDRPPEDEEEEDEEDLEEISEDENAPVSEKVDKSDDDEDDWDDWDEEDEEEEEEKPSEPQGMTKEEVSDMLNEPEEKPTSETPSMGLDAPPSADFLDKLVSGTPNRDKVAAALDKIDSPTKPKIKLNLDPSKTKNIKLNLKPKNDA